MKRINVILGLAVMVALALSAFVASSASAALPELTRPGTTAPVLGEITGESATGTKTVLETEKGTTVKCEKAVSKEGKAVTTKEITGIKIVFTGCTESVFGGKCRTKGSTNEGEITTGAITGLLGYLSKPESKEVGLELRPAKTPEALKGENSTFVLFECTKGFAKIEARGAVIGTLGAGEHNESKKSLKLGFETNGKGVQKDLGIKGGFMEEAHLESSLNEGKFEKSNQKGEGTTSVAGENAELKA